ncbi:MAG: ATP-binding cassette domain-containing protein [Candidatus Sumerlaeota bacterium]|nr:ATP-binding cassette domain-containing protein [Candidatus Sumerlaeota bacterium]
MITVEKLTKYYGEFPAVRDVSFQVGKGEILGFLGPNGAGKTTTMRILTCYTPATSGKATVAGFDVFTQSLEVRRRIGYLPENVPLYNEMTVRGYLLFMAEAKGHRGAAARKAVEQAINECGLAEVRNRLIAQISRGFRQRVSLGQAVLGNPDVLILDEPTIGLDPRQIVEIRNLIKNMAGKRTVILSTHILPEVALTCQKVLVIHRGRIVASGTPDEMISNLEAVRQTDVIARGAPDAIATALRSAAGVTNVRILHKSPVDGPSEFLVEYAPGKDPRGDMARAITQGGHALLEMRTRGLSLEDVFIRITAGEEAKHAA